MTHVLLIDDESATRVVMHNRLREAGYEVTLAENGAQGLTLAREPGFDLFLIDTGLSGGISSFEVCRRIRQMPHNTGVPLLLSSKSSSREDLPKGYEAGADACLVKSDLAVLEHVLRAFLRVKYKHDELVQQLRAQHHQHRRLLEERQREGLQPDDAHASDPNSVWRDMAPGKPDGVLVVDDEGVVRFSDRDAQELFGGTPLEGRNLGRLAPTSGLEAFVRDVRGEKRDGLRFDLPQRGSRGTRSLIASVVPMVVRPGEVDPGLRIVLLLDASKRRVAAELMRLQEYTLPRREVGVLLDAARVMYGTASLIGAGRALTTVRAQVSEAAECDTPVLIVGEPGSGRQHVARALHFNRDGGGPFLPFGCAGLSPEHLEAELFGQVKGAFPDALVDRPGALQQAAQGTVFLQEVEHVPLALQARLVVAIRDRVASRAGTRKVEPIDVRIVASTCVDLEAAVAAGRFDRELLRLLAHSVIVVAPLRERPEDLEALTLHFLRMFGSGRPELEIAPEALACLHNYGWPGNVLELKSCIERACRRTVGHSIGLEHLPPALRDLPLDLPARDLVPAPRPAKITVGAAAGGSSFQGFPYVQSAPAPLPSRPSAADVEEPISLHHYEKMCLERALEETRGDKLKAARLLKVGKSTLYRKLKRYGIT